MDSVSHIQTETAPMPPAEFGRTLMHEHVPPLLDGGASREQIERMLIDNPRRFFAGESLAAVH